MIKKTLEILLEENIKSASDINKESDSEHVYNKKFLKTKIKSHGDEVTDFYEKKFLMWTLIILV